MILLGARPGLVYIWRDVQTSDITTDKSSPAEQLHHQQQLTHKHVQGMLDVFVVFETCNFFAKYFFYFFFAVRARPHRHHGHVPGLPVGRQ